MFLVPLETHGIELRALMTIGGDRTNVTFLTDVHVGDEWRLGTVGGGWEVMRAALAYERGVFGNTNQGARLLRAVVAWAQNASGRSPLSEPTVRARLAEMAVQNEVASLLTLRTVLLASKGRDPGVEGAAAKLFASESYNRIADACIGLAGLDGLVRPGTNPPGAHAWEVAEAILDAPATTIYAGTSEVQRNLLALRHLRLPRQEVSA
jgi:hypothetical protein